MTHHVITQSGTTLTTGAEDDQIRIASGVANTSVMSGAGDDVIRSGPETSTASTDHGPHFIDAGAGHDRVELVDGFQSTVIGGAGDDRVTMTGVSDAVHIDTGDGNDRFILRSYDFGGDIENGNPNTVAASKVSIALGDGNDFADIAAVSSPMDTFDPDSTLGIRAGAGDDTIRLRLNELEPDLINWDDETFFPGWDPVVGVDLGGGQ